MTREIIGLVINYIIEELLIEFKKLTVQSVVDNLLKVSKLKALSVVKKQWSNIGVVKKTYKIGFSFTAVRNPIYETVTIQFITIADEIIADNHCLLNLANKLNLIEYRYNLITLRNQYNLYRWLTYTRNMVLADIDTAFGKRYMQYIVNKVYPLNKYYLRFIHFRERFKNKYFTYVHNNILVPKHFGDITSEDYHTSTYNDIWKAVSPFYINYTSSLIDIDKQYAYCERKENSTILHYERTISSLKCSFQIIISNDCRINEYDTSYTVSILTTPT